MVITGYRIKSQNIGDVTMELDVVKKRLKKMVNKNYHELLGEEIAFLVDNISTNAIQRNPDTTIYDDAVQNLDFKINNAKKTAAPTKYNFFVHAHILPLGDYTYIKAVCPNRTYLKAFDKMEEYSVDEIELQDKNNKKTQTWNELHKLYGNSEPMIINLSQSVEIDRKEIVYPTKKQRAETLARHTITSQLLNQISAGQQIPPILLMPYLDLAFSMFEQAEVKTEYQNKVTQLLQIFTDLNDDDSFIYITQRQMERQELENQMNIDDGMDEEDVKEKTGQSDE